MKKFNLRILTLSQMTSGHAGGGYSTHDNQWYETKVNADRYSLEGMSIIFWNDVRTEDGNGWINETVAIFPAQYTIIKSVD